MRGRSIVSARALVVVVVAACGACNLINGSSSLSVGGGEDVGGDDAGNDRADVGATPLPDGGGPFVDAAPEDVPPVPTTYTCSGDACFDAGTCEGGVLCPVRIVATSTGAIESIAASTAGVFWTIPASHEIHRLLVGSGGPTKLVSTTGSRPAGLAASASYVYWAEPEQDRVRRIGVNAPLNSAPDATKTGQKGVFLVTVGPGGGLVDWATSDGAIVTAADNLAASVSPFVGESPVAAIGQTSGSLYWVRGGSADQIRRATAAAAPATIAPGGGARALAAGEARIVWSTASSVSITLDGDPKTTFLGEGDPVAVAAAGDVAYWVDRAGGRIRRSPMAVPAGPETIIAGQRSPRAIAATSTTIYWVNDVGGEVWSLRVVKP